MPNTIRLNDRVYVAVKLSDNAGWPCASCAMWLGSRCQLAPSDGFAMPAGYNICLEAYRDFTPIYWKLQVDTEDQPI